MLPLLGGEGDYEEQTVLVGYSNNRQAPNNAMGAPAEGYAVRTHRWHFLWYADTGEMLLYDVTVDPRGNRDLSAERPELIADFQWRIDDWKASVGMTERIDIHE